MEAALYLEINLVSFFVVTLLIRNVQQASSSTLHERLLLSFLRLVAVILVADCATQLTDGRVFFGSFALGVVSNMLVFACGSTAALLWLLYVECRIHNDVERVRRYFLMFGLPSLGVIVGSVLSQPMHLIYYIDAACVYHRGPWFYAQMAVEIFYLLYAVFLAWRSKRAEQLQARRQEYHLMMLFGLFPMAGGVLEVLFYGIPTVWPLTVCAILMVVMNLQKNQMAADPLTGLNNRGRLDQYLAEQSKEFDRYQTLYMILMDVDHFKTVNDTYGHAMGDMALIRVAEALKRATAKSGDFVARYGGDEFAVVCRRRSDEEVENIEKQIRMEIRENNLTISEQEPKLALSMGFAALPRGGGDDGVEQLIANADAKMYEVKRLRHKMERWGKQPEEIDEALPTTH